MASVAQIGLLVLILVAYVVGGAMTVVRARASLRQLKDAPGTDAVGSRRAPARANRISLTLLSLGLAMSVILLVWHSWSSNPQQPLQDSFSAMLGLAILLAGFVTYIQWTRPIAALEWFAMPIVIMLLLMAGHFGEAAPQTYVPSAYSLVHRGATLLGAVGFAIAAACGAMYVRSARSLRAKRLEVVSTFGSLERLEHLTHGAVTLGFAFFTVGCLAGIAWASQLHDKTRLGQHWFSVLLASMVWLVYAVVLHTPITPRLRGRRNALLSIAGFILMLAAIFAVLLMPQKGG